MIDAKAQRAAASKMFSRRIQIICEKMVGSGYFDLLPKRLLKKMFERRYPPLKVRRATPNTLSEADALGFKRQYLSLIQDKEVETLRGETISFTWYVRDVLLLIHAIELHVRGGFSGAAGLLRAFKPYFRKGAWYEAQSKRAVEHFALAGVCGFSFYKGILVGRLDLLPFANPDTPNLLSLYRFPLQISHLKIEGNVRPLLQLASYKPEEGLRLVALSPNLMGFNTVKPEAKYPLLVQQHVFNRFEERTSLPAGFVHALLVNMVRENKFDCLLRKEKVLWACHMGSNKLGYFLVSIFRQCLVVRTFLLLTNMGTPEGNKLAHLTKMRMLDSKYLGIDRLETFIAHDVGGDPELRTLFCKAGCEPLLNFAEEMRPLMDEPLKSAAYMHRYLHARA